MEKPEVQFVERTLEILEDNKSFKHDMSLIINCTYGLLTFPHTIITQEKKKKKDVRKGVNWWDNNPPWNKDITEFPEVVAVLRKNHPQLLGDLLEKIRNGLDHQPFVPDNNSGKFTGIKIVIKKRGGKDGVEEDINWIFEASQDELKGIFDFYCRKIFGIFQVRTKTLKNVD